MHDLDVCAVHSGRTRSEVTALTDDARRRLLYLLGRVRRDQDAVFVTLTWPTWAAPTAEEWHSAWDRFRVRLIRGFPMVGGVWRREDTKAGVVHLHLLVYGVTYRDLRKWIPSSWADCVDAPQRDRRERVGTRVEKVRSWRAVPKYISKYCAKRDQVEADRAYGRWWGVFGQQNIPFSDQQDQDVSDAVAVRMIRTARRFVAAERRKRGWRRRGRAPVPTAGYTVLTVDPSVWSRWAALLWVYEAFPEVRTT